MQEAAKKRSKKMGETTMSYDLDDAAEMVQPSVGWHTAMLVAFEVSPNKAGTGTNCVFSLELDEADPDRPGQPWTYYVPLPSADLIEDYKKWVAAGNPRTAAWDANYMTKDGRHKYQASLARLKKVSSAFGGAETGKLDPAKFGRFVGKKVKLNLVPEKDQDTKEMTGRLQIGFDGVAPA
jgi:hypothetical protein